MWHEIKRKIVKWEEKHKKERISARGKIRLKFWNRMCGKRASKVIKQIDSTRNLEELMQNKYGENRNAFT